MSVRRGRRIAGLPDWIRRAGSCEACDSCASAVFCGRASEPFNTVGGDGDVEGTFVAFLEGRTAEGVILVGVVGIEDFHVAAAENLESVVEVCTGGEVLGAEAGAGIVDLEEFDGLRGVIADRSGDVRGMTASGGGKKAAERECEDGAHRVKTIRMG
jgi:hypothetical protein